jgi:hypothetical protein
VAARLTITDREAPRRMIDPEIRRRAEAIRRDAANNTPVQTGEMRRGWKLVKGTKRDGLWQVTNQVSYSVYVEYGTRHMRAQAPLGRAIARAEAR